MTKKLFLSQAEKVRTGLWSLSQNKLARVFFYLLILFLPTQLGKHFWPKFSFVFGLRLDYLSPTLYLTDIFILLIFVFSFKKAKQEIQKVNKKYLNLYFIFLLSLLLGLTNSLNPIAGVYGIVKILEYSFLVFYMSFSYKELNKQIIFSLIFVSIFFESLLSVFQYINSTSLGGLFYLLGERTYSAQTPGIANAVINGQLFLRPYATFSHPNILAGFLIISALYILMLNIEVKKNKTVIFIILIAAISLLLSLSRTVIALSLIYFFIFFVFEKFKNGKLKTAIFVFLILSFFIFLFSVLLKDSELVQRFLSLNLADESFVQRRELLNQATRMFIESPILGIGVNNFFNNLKVFNHSQVLLIQPVHNIFLLVLSETGIIGFVFFILVFFKGFLNILKNFTSEKIYLLFMFFAFIFIGFFDHYFLTIQQGQILLSLFLGTVFSYKKT